MLDTDPEKKTVNNQLPEKPSGLCASISALGLDGLELPIVSKALDQFCPRPDSIQAVNIINKAVYEAAMGADELTRHVVYSAAADAAAANRIPIANALAQAADGRVSSADIQPELTRNGYVINQDYSPLSPFISRIRAIEQPIDPKHAISELYGNGSVENVGHILVANFGPFNGQGFTDANGQTVINEAGVQMAEEFKSDAFPDTPVWAKEKQGSLRDAVIVNEESHAITRRQLNIYDRDIDWSSVNSGVTQYTILGTEEANEFLSDAVSVNTSRTDIQRIVTNALYDHFTDSSPADETNHMNGYAYSNTFALSKLDSILSRTGFNFEQYLKDSQHGMKSEWDNRPEIDGVRDIALNVLYRLSDEDVNEFQNAYMKQAQDLVAAIRNAPIKK